MKKSGLKVSFYLKKERDIGRRPVPGDGAHKCRQILRGGFQREALGIAEGMDARPCHGQERRVEGNQPPA